MALGSVAISGGMSNKEKERLMYMDGKLVWSSSSFSGTVPDTVDYVIVKNVVPVTDLSNPTQNIPTEVRVCRGGTGSVALLQYTRGGNAGNYWSYASLTFDANGTLSFSYPGTSYLGRLHVEGYHYY